MTFNAALFSIRPAHLLVRNVEEWDALRFELTRAYDGKDDELIDELLPPYLESWRAVTSNLLRDAFNAAGVTVAAPKHAWGIAVLTMNGSSCEPLLCDAEDTVDGRAEAAVYGGLRLLNFEGAVASYAASLRRLPGEDLQRELIRKRAKSRTDTEVQQRTQALKPVRKVTQDPAHEAALRRIQEREEEYGEGLGR